LIELYKASTATSFFYFISKTFSLSQSGNDSKAEGGDFILESANKKIKSWMPPVVPTEERWLRVCQNITSMEKVVYMSKTYCLKLIT
jgi:hypothetical protein